MSLVLADVEGLTLTDDDRDLLKHPYLAGIIFFQRNFSSYEQLSALVSEIRELTCDRPFLLAVDQEGGRVQRFHQEFTSLPALGTLASSGLSEQQLASLCHELGWLMASEIRCAGIDISFAPVLDVDVGVSKVIGKRSFGSSPEVVIPLARSYIEGMNEAGMLATVKHFPGHGGVKADSHLESPLDMRSFDDLWQQEAIVFEQLLVEGVGAVMPAHVTYPAIDPQPASFSPYWLQQTLRDKLGFNGCVFSDDLSMQAARAMGGPASRAIQAIDAGCDIILCCNDRTSALQMLDQVALMEPSMAASRLSAMCGTPTPWPKSNGLSELHATRRYQLITERLEALQDSQC